MCGYLTPADEEAAVVVRRISAMALSGMCISAIAAVLNNEKAETASEYHERHGHARKGRHRPVEGKTLWMDSNVRRILTDERYTGVQILCKTKRAKIGSGKIIKLPESEWLRFPDLHDAVISAEDFLKTKELLARPKASEKTNQPKREPVYTPYSQKIRCGCCGYALEFMRGNNRQHYYRCKTQRLVDSSPCFTGKLYLDEINDTVLSALKVEARKQFGHAKKGSVGKPVPSVNHVPKYDESAKLSARLSGLENRMITLYENYVDGLLSKQSYLEAKSKCEDEQSLIESKMKELSERPVSVVAETKQILVQKQSALDSILSANEVTPEIASLIKCVTVYDVNRIEIAFAFIDSAL